MSVFDELLPEAAEGPAVRELLARYVALLLERNAHMNLTAARDSSAVAVHVRDALSLLPWLREPYVDVGSGGGFPAIPLVIASGMRATLIESVAKKAAFLSAVARELALPVKVVAGRAEEAGRDVALRERFASATARAVGSASVVLELTLPLLEIGGVAILQRGRLESAERHAFSDALLVLGGELLDEIPVAPGDTRRVVLVRKAAATSPRFPRRAGVPAKRPLCAGDGL